MPTYEQNKYCTQCKKNVPADKNDRCKICGEKIQRGTWSARFRIMEFYGEKHKRLSGYGTKREAQQAFIHFMSTYNPLQNNNRTSYIFEEILKEYFAACAIENEESTLYDKQMIFNLFITPHFKRKEIPNITKADIVKWQTALWNIKNPKTHLSYAWKYLTKIRGYLYNFLNYCEKVHDMPNQFRTIITPKNKNPKRDMNFWELNEFNQFISTVANPLRQTLYYVFMYTGARFNEIRALSDDDIKNGIITINKSMSGKKVQGREVSKTTKNHRIITKRIPDILLNKVTEYKVWKKENNISKHYLFGGDSPMSETTLRRFLKEDFRSASKSFPELKYISPHGFRHSYVSMLIHLGVSTKIIAELIGDREEQVIKTYGHLYAGAKEEAIALLNSKISDLCT